MRLSPGALDTLKWLALVTMTLDHVNTLLLYSQHVGLLLIGRLSFPLFAFLVAYNAVHRSRRPRRYLGRLALLAVVSQPVYAHALYHDRLNVFATLGVGLLALLLGRTPLRRALACGALLAAWLLAEELGGAKVMSFGLGGALLVAVTGAALRPGAGRLWGAAALAVLAGLNLGWDWSLASRVAATVAAAPLVLLVAWADVRLPMPRARWLWYAYYPGHLLILALIRDHLS